MFGFMLYLSSLLIILLYLGHVVTRDQPIILPIWHHPAHCSHTHTPFAKYTSTTLTSFLEFMASIIFTERKTYQAAIFWIGYITGGDQNDPRSTMVLGARTGKPPRGSQSLTNRQVHVGILNRSKINYGCRSKKYGQSTLGLLIACKSKSACRYSQSIRDQIWL